MTVGAFLFLALGLVLLVGGAELLVRGASRLALRCGISPLVIGLTVVAFGTSTPELAVSAQSGLAGQSGMALGNIVGSNVFNVLVVLGLSALITPLVVHRRLIRVDVPLLCAVSVLLWLLALDGRIGVADGLTLAGGVIAYTVFAIRQVRREAPSVHDEYAREFGSHNLGPRISRLPTQVGLIGGGLTLLVIGSQWLVASAVLIAQAFDVSEVIIGLTIVAAGTSLPELATSAVAALRGERDIAVGNAIGSSLFNILAVAGFAALVTPGALVVSDALIRVDIPIMIAVAMLCVPVFSTGHTVSRWEGGVFLSSYGAYMTYLVLAATGHNAETAFVWFISRFVLPLIAVTWLGIRIRDRITSGREPRVGPQVV